LRRESPSLLCLSEQYTNKKLMIIKEKKII
jgi:hypothetical protein